MMIRKRDYRLFLYKIREEMKESYVEKFLQQGHRKLNEQGITNSKLMLARFDKERGNLLTATEPEHHLADCDKIPDWGKNAVHWAVANGIIIGNNGSILPKDYVKVSEAVAIFPAAENKLKTKKVTMKSIADEVLRDYQRDIFTTRGFGNYRTLLACRETSTFINL